VNAVNTRVKLALASLLGALAISTVAHAHLGNISYADFTVRGRGVLVEFKYASHLTPGLPLRATNPTRAELLAHETDISNWIADTTRVDSSSGQPCRFELDNVVGPDRNQDLDVIGVWTCEGDDIKGLRIDFHPLALLLDDWQTIASMKLAGQNYSTVFTPGATTWQVGETVASSPASRQSSAVSEPATESSSAFARFFRLGVWHIWTGYDHLLFLLAVLLAGGGIARIAGIVTSFTVAHSITLGAAATGLVRLPVAPVEAAIAVSIVFVAVENLLERGADRRALVTFFFGLIHGFGFASVLAGAALPAGGILVPLLAFNLGVEAGQLVVVAAVVPLLSVALRSSYGRTVKRVLSALIAIAGAVWAIERIAAIFAAAT